MRTRSDRFTTIRLLIYPPLEGDQEARWSINLCRHRQGVVNGAILASGTCSLAGPTPGEREVWEAILGVVTARVNTLRQ